MNSTVKNYENWSASVKVIVKTKVVCFLRHGICVAILTS